MILEAPNIIPAADKSIRLLAVCHNCNTKHAISINDILRTDAIRDWEIKHNRHRIEFLQPDAYERSIAHHAVRDYKHNANIKLSYAADVDYTITLASLAESSTLLTGRESGSVDNTTNLYLDYMISGHITTGTSPTVDEAIQVIAIGSEDDTPTWPDVFDGSDSAETFTNVNVKNGIARYIATLTVTADSDISYSFGPISLAQLFGVIPTFHVVFVTHDTDVNLKSDTQVITQHGIFATST